MASVPLLYVQSVDRQKVSVGDDTLTGFYDDDAKGLSPKGHGMADAVEIPNAPAKLQFYPPKPNNSKCSAFSSEAATPVKVMKSCPPYRWYPTTAPSLESATDRSSKSRT